MSKYNHTVEIDNFASRRSRVPERQKIVKLNCVARDLQTYVIKDLRSQSIMLTQKMVVNGRNNLEQLSAWVKLWILELSLPCKRESK